MKSDNIKTKYFQVKHKQQGAILFISLMILLVLTLIGINSLNGSLLEEKMAANAQTSTTVFQSAEAAIRTTYYAERADPEDAVDKARTGTVAERTRNYTFGDTTSDTVLVYKSEVPLPNYSSDFIGHGVEIVGTASMNNIQEPNARGFNIFPFPAPNQ